MRGQKVKVSDKISTPETPISAYLYKNVQNKHIFSSLFCMTCTLMYRKSLTMIREALSFFMV